MDAKLPEIEPLQREQRLYERVVDRILALIQDGTWQPGDRLPPERDLAEAFAVSRTVVREAVKVLEARGVLESLTGSGIYVRQPDSAMVARSLYMYLQLLGRDDLDLRLAEIRRVLEVEIAALAAERATADQRQELIRICGEMKKFAQSPRVLAELDFSFHQLLAEATQNELFGVLLTPLMQQLRGHFAYAWEHYGARSPDAVLAQHEAIAQAVNQGDGDLARAMMSEHIAYYCQILRERLDRGQHSRQKSGPNGQSLPTSG